MALFDRVITNIEKNKAIKDNGGFVGIPYPFSRLREFIPAIEKGHSIGLLAGTGVGKSRFARFVFLYYVYTFAKKNNYPVKIYYFPLEDNKEKVYNNLICHYAATELGIRIDIQDLNSRRDRSLSTHVLEAIKQSREFFIDLENYVEFVDNISHPREIYKYLAHEATTHGKLVTRREEGTEKPIFESYTPNDDTHRIVIVDNLYNFDSEKGEVERDLMVQFCKKYVREWLCNKFGFSVIQVMQMSFDKERQQFTNSGMSIVSKLEPSLDGIGEAKVIARSMHVILGLFNPDRYELLVYPNSEGYNIGVLQDRFRALKILKSNDSPVGMRIGLLFDAVAETFTQLPNPKEKEELEKVYNYVKSLQVSSALKPVKSLF